MELQLESIGITKDFLKTIESEYRIILKKNCLAGHFSAVST